MRLANIYDGASAHIVGALPNCHALATGSAAVAAAVGTTDEGLDLATHLAALRPIAAAAAKVGKPLTVDLQDGYGADLERAVAGAIALGAVGANIEDARMREGAVMMPAAEAEDRIRRAVAAAAAEGVPDFVVNARADSWLRGGTLEESVSRGKKYLAAGATTVYVLPPKGALTAEDVKAMVEGLGGMVNIGARVAPPGKEGGAAALSVGQLAELGIARISVGPQLYHVAAQALRQAAGQILD